MYTLWFTTAGNVQHKTTTVQPAKSGSDVMFSLKTYQEVTIDRSLLYRSYPQDRINTEVNYRFTLDQVGCTS